MVRCRRYAYVTHKYLFDPINGHIDYVTFKREIISDVVENENDQ